MIRSYLLLSAALMLLGLASCAGSGSNDATSLPPAALPQSTIVQAQSPAGDGSLPLDTVQPWEALDAAGHVIPTGRSTSGINQSSDLTPGVERYSESGEVIDNGEASRISSAPGSSASAMYRIALGGNQPGVVSVDANLLSGTGYYLGIADYDSGRWNWHGPFTDNHVRISTARPGPWTSNFGNLFVSVLAYAGAAVDVVGIGVNPVDVLDTDVPPVPTGLSATAVNGALSLSWDAVLAGDLAGYRVFYSDKTFINGNTAGVQRLEGLEGATDLLLRAAGLTFLRISAVDISGNESALSDIVSATALPGAAPALKLAISQPSGGLNEAVILTAHGADSYDFDLDGDGIYDITADTLGTAQVDTSALGIIRPAVRATGSLGTAIALGAVSLIISGNSRPVAVANSDTASGTVPLTVNFSGTDSTDFDGSVVGGGWDFDGDGTYDVWDDTDIVHVTAASFEYTTPGTYNAKLRVVDDAGTWDVDTLAITVSPVDPGNQDPVASLQVDNLKGDAPLAVGFSAFGSVDPDGLIVEFAWDWEGDGLYDAIGEGTGASHIYTAPGIYNAKVRVEDNSGARDTATVEINVGVAGNDPPVADLISDRTTDYAPFTVNFDASGSSDADGSIVLFEWDFNGDGNFEQSGASPTASYTYPVRGWYSAGLRVTDNVGAQATASLNITLPSEWSGFSGPAQSRRSPYVGAPTSDIKWTQTTGNNGPSSPAIGPDGTVYIGSTNNNLYALRSNDGSIKWSFSTGGTVASSPSIADDGTIYVGSNDNKLYAVNPDGTEKWFVDIDGFDVGAPPTVGPDGAIYASAGFGTLVALNPDGSIRWERAATGIATNAAVALATDGTIYFCDVGSSGLRAINPDGSNKWLASTGIGSTSSAPAVGEDGTVYVGAGDGQLYAINPDGSQKWTYDLMNFFVNSSPAIASDGTVYIGHADNKLYAINPDGSFKWSYETGDKIITSSPAIGADGTIYVGSEDDSLYAITPAGSLLWSAATGGNVNSSPAIGRDGTVYVGCNDSEFYAFGN
jgi:outer membrane protein assembly factor BamB